MCFSVQYMMKTIASQQLASGITKTASQQTYYTIRFLVDRERVADAYRAYAYFRWVDDTLDGGDFALNQRAAEFRCSSGEWRSEGHLRRHAVQVSIAETKTEVKARQRIAFLERQKSLLEKCYHGESFPGAIAEENMLVELVKSDHEKNSGLQSYLRNMMQVMEFDARRRSRLITQAELNEYTRWLASAVTEAMHHFIGHRCYSPHDETRYLAVAGAHITHMLRDTYDDVQAGYYNIPREVLEADHIQPYDIHSKAYRTWVQGRVQLARQYFKAGREYLARVEEPRCRLAGLAYTARFEWLLDTIEQENYSLRPEYSERRSVGTGLRMGLLTLSSLVNFREAEPLPQPVASHSLREF